MTQGINWGTTWTAIGALATITALYFPIKALIVKKRKKLHVFISMQMSHLAQKEYSEAREDIMALIYELRKYHEVFFYNEFIHNLAEFNESKFDPHAYLKEIEHCDYFIALILEKIPSSIYFEAGYALAVGKKSVYYVIDDNVMPLVMHTASSDHKKIKVIRAKSLNDIKPRILNLLNHSKGTKTA